MSLKPNIFGAAHFLCTGACEAEQWQGRWLNNELKTMVDALLNPSKLKSQEIFNPTYVSQILLSFKKKPKQELSKVWNLLVFQMWYEKWMK